MNVGIGIGIGLGTLLGGESPGATYFLRLNGIDEYLKTPSITFNKIVMDMKSRAANSTIYLDARSGHSLGYFQKTGTGLDNYGSSISSVKVDGITKTNNTAIVPFDTKITLEVNFSSTAADDANIYSNSAGTAVVEGDLYDIKFYNGATLQAHYDMSTQSVQDQSGNGNHATLIGGTFVSE